LKFEVFEAFPPNEQGPVAELNVHHAGGIDIPMWVSRKDGVLQVTVWGSDGKREWEFPLDELLDGLRRAAEVLSE
jgi:hypothetical protein